MIETNSDSIYIYGDITPYDEFDSDMGAKSFVDALNSFGGQDATIHVNSAGGDVFEALAIHNAIKNYSGTVTAQVDGLAASAASLIVCAADKIVMAKNALMMLHMPSVCCCGYYNSADLSKMSERLAAIENSVVESYQDRLNRSNVQTQPDILSLLKAETWLDAQSAVKWGFADEITDTAVDIQINDDELISNKLHVDLKLFNETNLRKALKLPKMSAPKPADVVREIRNRERSRIQDLMKLRGQNQAADALIEVAIENGKTVAELQPYLDAVKNVSTLDGAVKNISAMIRDQMNSGAENVIGCRPAFRSTGGDSQICERR